MCTPPSLLRGSRLSAGACTRACLPAPLSESLGSFLPAGTCTWAPRPTLCLIRLPFSLVISPALEPPWPTASPASLLPGQSRLSAPAPWPAGYPTAIANNTFLVAVDAFSSTRTSQERCMDEAQGRWARAQALALKREPWRREAAGGTHLPSLVCTWPGPIAFLLSLRPLVLIIVTFLTIVTYMWRHSLWSWSPRAEAVHTRCYNEFNHDTNYVVPNTVHARTLYSRVLAQWNPIGWLCTWRNMWPHTYTTTVASSEAIPCLQSFV